MAATDRTYDAIRAGIANGLFPSGAHLRAADIADRFGVSRTPVREALRRLHAEGLVELFANRGAFVADSSPRDVDEVFDLRVVLEGHAAELSARRFTPHQITELSAWTDEMDRSVAATVRDIAGLNRANHAFHRAIITTASNQRLATMIASVVEISWVSRTFSIYSDADLAASIAHHREMVRAFVRRDGVWAASVMRAHIRAAYHVFVLSLGSGDPARPSRSAD